MVSHYFLQEVRDYNGFLDLEAHTLSGTLLFERNQWNIKLNNLALNLSRERRPMVLQSRASGSGTFMNFLSAVSVARA